MRSHWAWALLPLCVSGGVFPLDNAVPWPSSGGARVLWSQGWDAFAVASSRCVRLNERGVYTLPGHWAARDLPAAGWVAAPCVPVRGALCRARVVRAFPLEQVSPPPAPRAAPCCD